MSAKGGATAAVKWSMVHIAWHACLADSTAPEEAPVQTPQAEEQAKVLSPWTVCSIGACSVSCLVPGTGMPWWVCRCTRDERAPHCMGCTPT